MILISGPVSLCIEHPNIKVIRVTRAEEMYEKCHAFFPSSTIGVLTAAVADYSPGEQIKEKMKRGKEDWLLRLKPTRDIAASLGKIKNEKQLLVGFALETDNEIENAIDESTALVTLSHVAFKSAFMYVMAQVTQRAHDAGALVLWDLSHSAGAVPVDLNGCNVDMAVGCTYKYLNGGPGSPAFLYVRKDLQEKLIQPMWGWLGADNPFQFELDFRPAKGLSRFKVGTPPILSMTAIQTGVDMLLEAGMNRLRQKSLRQTKYVITLFDAWLAPLGFSLGSPRDAEQRGSHVSLQHPEAFRITRALIETPPPEVRVIPDFRTPDNIRFGITPLYTSYMDIYRAMDRLRDITKNKIYQQYSAERQKVT